MAGAAATVIALSVLKPAGTLPASIYLLGVVVLVGWVVRVAERGFQPGIVAGVAFALAGGVGLRLGVLLQLTGQQIEVLKGGAIRGAFDRLIYELGEPGQRTMAGSSSDGPPLVLITVDTLRGDVGREMEAYRRIAAHGGSWPAGMSTSSWTLPGTASIATGLLTGEHGAGFHPDGHYQGISPDVRTLAEDLQAAGYSTAAIASNPWVSRQMGFDRGFDRFVQVLDFFPHQLLVTGVPRTEVLPNHADPMVERVLGWIDSAPERGWYLWVHVIDPHMPYDRADDARFHGVTSADLRAGELLDGDAKEGMRRSYQQMVDMTDASLLPLIDALEAKGVFAEGLVAFTSDHGEELWDHDNAGHGHSHHGEVLDVPLALAAPGMRVGVRSEAASVTDIASTFRAAAGLATSGVDLREDQAADRVVTAWGNLHYGIERSARTGEARLIVDEESGEARYFDLSVDPLERVPRGVPEGDPLMAAVEGVVEPPRAEAVELDDMSALQALGYVE